MYFTPDGASAIVVAEARERLDFRDPHTMALHVLADRPGCDGHQPRRLRRHAASYALVTCEFAGDDRQDRRAHRTVVGLLDLTAHPVAGQPAPETDDDARRHAGLVDAAGRARRPRRPALLRGRHAGRGRLPTRRRHVRGRALHPHRASAPTASRPAATARCCTSPTGAPPRSAAHAHGPGQRERARPRDRNTVTATWAVPRRRQPRHGQPERGRHRAVAVRSLRQRGLRLRHRARRAR